MYIHQQGDESAALFFFFGIAPQYTQHMFTGKYGLRYETRL